MCVFCDVHARASTDSHTHRNGWPRHGRVGPRPGAGGTTDYRLPTPDFPFVLIALAKAPALPPRARGCTAYDYTVHYSRVESGERTAPPPDGSCTVRPTPTAIRYAPLALYGATVPRLSKRYRTPRPAVPRSAVYSYDTRHPPPDRGGALSGAGGPGAVSLSGRDGRCRPACYFIVACLSCVARRSVRARRSSGSGVRRVAVGRVVRYSIVRCVRRVSCERSIGVSCILCILHFQ
jgi:hypothetical protein